MASELPDLPHNMRKVQRRFELWRSAHTGRLPIPERLWAAATDLAREHGIFPTAKALRLEYGKLKQFAEAARGPEATTAARFQNGSLGRRAARRRAAKTRVKRASVSRARSARQTAPPAFVELLAPRPGSSPECRVELEGPRGRMRIDFKGVTTAELVALSRALWDGEIR